MENRCDGDERTGQYLFHTYHIYYQQSDSELFIPFCVAVADVSNNKESYTTLDERDAVTRAESFFRDEKFQESLKCINVALVSSSRSILYEYSNTQILYIILN